MTELYVGLEGVAIAETQISNVDGQKGELIYHGIRIEDVVKNCYEDVVYLLWHGHLPSEKESKAFKEALRSRRTIPDYLKDIIRSLPKDLDSMSVIRTGLSALKLENDPWPPTPDQAIDLLAKAPTIVTYHYNLAQGNPEREPDPSLDHVANYLYMLHGEKPKESHVRALDTYFSICAEHGMNASTFTALVVTSTQSDIISAVSAAIGALKGPLHGGAPSEVDSMIDEIGTEANAEPWLRDKLENDVRLRGFGHRVYKTYDPRAAALKEITREFAHDNDLFKLSLFVEDMAIKLLAEYKPGRNLYPNLEFWAAGVLRTIKLPTKLYTPSFCCARIAGWSAHVMEQAANNRLIRPSSIYVGPKPD